MSHSISLSKSKVLVMTFKENKLAELCDIVSSKRVFAASYQSEGVPFFRGKEVSQLARGEDTTAELYISNEVYFVTGRD